MKAVYIKEFGWADFLEIREIPEPQSPRATQVLVRVMAAGINRADILQRRGLYPPPTGYSPYILGLEFAGEIIETGPNVSTRSVGERVFGITSGEAQAELLLVDETLTAPIPASLGFCAAAAIPEAFVTAHDALFSLGRLARDESLLIHAVGSGVGLAALQLAKTWGAMAIGTSRNADKLEKCREFGLDAGIDTSSGNGDFSETVMELTDGTGVNVILDLVGAAYLGQNLRCMAEKGRLLLVGLSGGARAEFDLSLALSRRIHIIGTTLRSRSTGEKAEALARFIRECGPLFESGALKPNLDTVFPIKDAAEAHRCIESNANFGKLVLEIARA